MCTATYPKCKPELGAEPEVFLSPCVNICQNVHDACVSNQDKEAVEFFIDTNYFPLNCDADIWSSTSDCNFGPGNSAFTASVASCVEHKSVACQGVVKELAYLPPGFTNDAISRSTDQLQYLFSLSSITYGCDIAQATYICGDLMPSCQMVNVYGDRTVPAPRRPCQSVCTNYLTACDSFFLDFEQIADPLLPVCSSTAMMEYTCPNQSVPVKRGIAKFPTQRSILHSYTRQSDGSQGEVTSTCINFSDPDFPSVVGSDVKSLNVLCPYPLVVPEDNGSNEFVARIFDSHCSPGCPMGMWTLDEYQVFDNVAIAGILISLIFSVFLSITWFCFDIRRQNMYVTYMTYVISVMYIFIFAMYIKNWVQGHSSGAHALCRTNFIEYQMGDNGGSETAYCVFNAAIVVYCVSSIVAWWLVQTIAVFSKVVLERKVVPGSRQDTIQNVVFHFIGFGLPAICVIGMIAAGAIGGYSSGLSWCFFSQGRYDKNFSTDYSLALFFVPIMVYTGLGTICMGGVMAKLAWISRRGAHNENKTMWQRCMCNVYIRIILFILTMCALWITVIVYKAESLAKQNVWAEGLDSYYLCTLVTQYIISIDCGDHPSVRMPYHLQFLITFCITWAGGIITATNATTSDIYVEWSRFFIRILPCFKRMKCCVSLSQYRGTTDVTGQSDETRSYTNPSGEKSADKSSSSASNHQRRHTIMQTNRYFYSPRNARKSTASGPGVSGQGGPIDLRTSAQLSTSFNGSTSDPRHSNSGEIEMVHTRREGNKSHRGTTLGSVNLGSIVESIEKSRSSMNDDDEEREAAEAERGRRQVQVPERKRRRNHNKYNSQFSTHFGSQFGSHYGSHFGAYNQDDFDDDDDEEEEETVTNLNVFMPDDEEEDGRVSRVLFADGDDSFADKKIAATHEDATRTSAQFNSNLEDLPKPSVTAEEDLHARQSAQVKTTIIEETEETAPTVGGVEGDEGDESHDTVGMTNIA